MHTERLHFPGYTVHHCSRVPPWLGDFARLSCSIRRWRFNDHPSRATGRTAAAFHERGRTWRSACLQRFDPSTAGRIMSGKVRARPATVVALARALGVSPRRMQQMCEARYLAVHPEEALEAPEPQVSGT